MLEQWQEPLLPVLINSFPGDTLGQAGVAKVSDSEYMAGLEKSRDYLRALDCKILHLMAGKVAVDQDRAKCFELYVERVRKAAKMLENDGVTIVLEPISYFVAEDYLLNDFGKAVELIKEVGRFWRRW